MSANVVLFLALVSLPAVLMAVAHVYAVFAQDVRRHYLVVLTTSSASELVASEHAQRYGVAVDHVWSSPDAKGYSGSLSVRNVSRLERDPAVVRVELRDHDEFLDPS